MAIAVPKTGSDPGASTRGGPRTGASSREGLLAAVRRNVAAHGFLLGAVLCFAVFSWYPMIREFFLSFQKVEGGKTVWVGMHNLNTISNDPIFWQAWRNTAQFTLYALVLGFVMPFVAAIVLNELRHGKAYLRILVYLPVMLPPVASLVLFQYFYNPDYGLFDEILKAVGLPTSMWLQSPDVAMLAVCIASTWMNMGSATLIYLAALQNIPGELYEAAELDGAGLFKRIWHVTVPQTRSFLSLMLLLQIVATMQVFVEPFVLTNGGQGVAGSTATVLYLIYNYAFQFSNYGAASALGLSLLIVLAIFSFIYVRLSRRVDES